jgi:hypothetical protein
MGKLFGRTNLLTRLISIDGATIGGNLHIQQLSASQPPGAVWGTVIKGNLTVQNNGSPIEIGTNNANACAGNMVGGNLQAGNNYAALWIDDNNVGGNLQVNNDTAATDVSGNTVADNLQCQTNTPAVTYAALNMMQGQAQGQCAYFP